MKKISITESEKENILNIHIKYGYNNLSEQSVIKADDSGLGRIKSILDNLGLKTETVNMVQYGKAKIPAETIKVNTNIGTLQFFKYKPGGTSSKNNYVILTKNNVNTSGTWDTANLYMKTEGDVNFGNKEGFDNVININKLNSVTDDNQNFKEFFDKWPCLNYQGYTDKEIQTKDNNKYFTFKNGNVLYAIKLSDGKMYKKIEDGDYETTNTIAKCPDKLAGLDEQLSPQSFDKGFSKTLPVSDKGFSLNTSNVKTDKKVSDSTSASSKNTQNIFKKGMKGENIQKIKQQIADLVGGDIRRNLKVNLENDLYDDKMTAMVAYFQAINDIKVDGIVGPETLSKMKN
jgi:hypothetical protein